MEGVIIYKPKCGSHPQKEPRTHNKQHFLRDSEVRGNFTKSGQIFEHLKKIARWTVKARNLGLRQDPPFVQLPQEQFNH